MPKRTPLDKLFQSLGDALYDAAMDAAEALQAQAQSSTFTPIIPPVERTRTTRTGKPPRKAPRPPKTPPSPFKPPELTLYDTLEVSPRASQAVISGAFRSLSAIYHPDKYTNDKGSRHQEEKYKAITAAYSTLKSPDTRKQYDRSIGLKG